MNKHKKSREILINHLISSGYLSTPEVISAMRAVKRHKFIPKDFSQAAYSDQPLPISDRQTISAPHMVAMMTELLDVKIDSKILEIGSGSGYQAAVLAEIAKDGKIYTIERIPALAEFARENLKNCGYKNVKIIIGDGTLGYAKCATFDRILVTAGAPKIPDELIKQLSIGGKMVIPVGDKFQQELVVIEKQENELIKKKLGGCFFVPLIGKDGHNENSYY